MMIYTNASSRVISVGRAVAGATAIDIIGDEIFSAFSDTRKLCYYYKADGTFSPAIDLSTIALLESKQAEIDGLNSVVDTLIIDNLGGGDNV